MSTQNEIYESINRREIPQYSRALWQKLSNFVEDTCTQRDASHGFIHMQQVARTSLFIQSQDYPEMPAYLVNVLICCAWLHDVADHKYDSDGNLKKLVTQFLGDNLPEYKDQILRVIKYSSYTMENKKQITDWNQVFGDPVFLIIRNIMSDSDKLDTLGSNGIVRVIEYAQYIGANIKEHLYYIGKDRILILKDKYIRTNTGKQLAEIFHAEFESLFNLNFL